MACDAQNNHQYCTMLHFPSIDVLENDCLSEVLLSRVEAVSKEFVMNEFPDLSFPDFPGESSSCTQSLDELLRMEEATLKNGPATQALEKALQKESSSSTKRRQGSFSFAFLDTLEVEDVLTQDFRDMVSTSTRAEPTALSHGSNPAKRRRKNGLNRTMGFSQLHSLVDIQSILTATCA